MCGINGFTFRDPEMLRKMHRITAPRGPDDEGFFESDACSFAHNRLSILDLTEKGRQPMTSADGRFTLVYNGEIYNYLAIRSELEQKGYRFSSQTDSEVLLVAWQAWGEAALSKFNGMFAFAVWDRDTREIVLVRDGAGIKPLYYHTSHGKLIFSSNLRAILATGVSKEIDPTSLNLFFRFLYVPSPRTLVASIQKLQPGSLLRFCDGRIAVKKWHIIKEGPYFTNKLETIKTLKYAAETSVARRLISERPLGIFLSGGIDSTAILGMASAASAKPLQTFSVGYEKTEQSEKYNADFHIARRTAEYFGTDHHEILVSGKMVADAFPNVISAMDEPISNHNQPSIFFLAKEARKDIVVALGGDGADELFGGYGRYWMSDQLNHLQKLPAWMRSETFLTLLGKSELSNKLKTKQGIDRFLAFMGHKPNEVLSILNPSFFNEATGREIFSEYFHPLWGDFTNQFMAVDLETWLPDESLLKSDKLTMAFGLEQRVPFLDPELLHLAYRIPSKWKLDHRYLGKKLFREAVNDYLPDFVKDRRKAGFFSPAAKWLRSDLLPIARDIFSDNYVDDPYIDTENMRGLLEDHVMKRGYHLNIIWAAMTYRVWKKTVLDA